MKPTCRDEIIHHLTTAVAFGTSSPIRTWSVDSLCAAPRVDPIRRKEIFRPFSFSIISEFKEGNLVGIFDLILIFPSFTTPYRAARMRT